MCHIFAKRQYYGDNTTQYNGVLTLDYMKALFKDFISAIKAQLPNALISWDISAWIDQDGFKKWLVSNMRIFENQEKSCLIIFIYFQGGRTSKTCKSILFTLVVDKYKNFNFNLHSNSGLKKIKTKKSPISSKGSCRTPQSKAK